MFALVVFYPLKAFDYYGIVALVELVKLILVEIYWLLIVFISSGAKLCPDCFKSLLNESI